MKKIFALGLLLMGVVLGGDGRAEELKSAVVREPLVTTLGEDGLERDDEALCGQIARVTGPKNGAGLVPVVMEYGYATWLSPEGLTSDGEAWASRRNARVISLFVDVLPQPSVQAYPPLIELPRGAWVQAEPSEDSAWAAVTLPDGRKGFVKWKNLRAPRVWNADGEEVTRARLVEDALAYRGVAYRWGGKSPRGLDCSGFTSLVYDLNGLSIYRNSRPEAGYPVALLPLQVDERGKVTRQSLEESGIKPGDLLFWPGHTGLYLGGGRYIHANGGSSDVSVNSLLPGEPGYRADLADAVQLVTFGTAFPDRSDELTVSRVWAEEGEKEGVKGRYLFARLKGYAPTKVLIDPDGSGDESRFILLEAPRRMILEPAGSRHKGLPFLTDAQIGSGTPKVKFINDTGYRPKGKRIESDWVALEGGEDQ